MEAAGFGVESLEMEAIRNEDEDENHKFALVRGTVWRLGMRPIYLFYQEYENDTTKVY